MTDSEITLPQHLAIVPDGNGRWAESRGLPRVQGHRAGAENSRRVIGYLNEYPLKCVTFYTFSTENWNRPAIEVQALFRLIEDFINNYLAEIKDKDIRVKHIGRLEGLPDSLQRAISRAVTETAGNRRMILNVAFNYGGRAEIVDAVRGIIRNGIQAKNVDEKLFESYLYTAGLPDVDLVVRTGDELRLSNFLIWQSTYSEYHFTKTLWPDFGREDIEKALKSFSQRRRRFGGL